MPVSGGTTAKLCSADWPQRRKVYRSRLRENSMLAFSEKALAWPA